MTDPTEPMVAALRAMGDGPLTEEALVAVVHPLFKRVLARKEIYLANHSLGRPPDATADVIREALDHWYTDMDAAWGAWLAEMDRFRASVASLVGCARTTSVVPKASAGQGLRAVLAALHPKSSDGVLRVVTTAGEFDSLDFILRAWAASGRIALTVVDADADGLLHADVIANAVHDATDLVVVSHVVFSTGQVIEGLDGLIAHAHHHGAKVLVDVYHSAGVLPLALDALGVDAAVGGSYKYLRGGPGASWLVLGKALADDPSVKPLDTGWFGKLGTFDYGRGDVAYKPGGDGWQESTPAVLPYYQARAGMAFVQSLGVPRLRAYSLAQQQYLTEALKAEGVSVRATEPHGAFVCVPCDDLQGVVARCRAAGLNIDGRPGPDGRAAVRLCPDVLNTRFELREAAKILAGRG